jgi:hypothetical protein
MIASFFMTLGCVAGCVAVLAVFEMWRERREEEREQWP